MKTHGICSPNPKKRPYSCAPMCLFSLVPPLVAALAVFVMTSPAAARGGNISICHVPQGDPGAAHTIVVSERALEAHLGHGDTLGQCGSQTTLCGPGTDPCGEYCRDFSTDENNCGGCNHTCEAGEICRGGSCEVPGWCGNGSCDGGESCTTCAADCSQLTEICDGRDNDCDGSVDEDFPGLGQQCTVGIGGCARTGQSVCGSTGQSTQCSVEAGPPSDEICDGFDNDCDGATDEGLQCTGVISHCGAIDSDETWVATAVHIVACDVSVTGDATLTIKAGTTVKLVAGVSILVPQAEAARIHMQGTATQPVTLTSAANQASPGDWGGLQLGPWDRGSQIDFADIQYCGQVDGCLILDGASPSITHTVIQYSGTRGIFAAGAAFPRIQNTTVQYNGGNGIDISGPGGLDPGARFSSNVISSNGGYPIGVPARSVGQLDTSSSFSGNGSDYVRIIAGTVSRDATWSGLDVPYRVAGDVSVGGVLSPLLTVEAGAILLFEPGSDLVVGPDGSPGAMIASGTSALPIRFSSAQGTPSPGDWGGIRLESACTGPPVLDHVIVEYAGANGLGNVVWQSCNGTIGDSTVSHSSHWGIYRSNANPVITNVTYSDNADGDINP